MAELGVDMGEEFPKPLTDEVVRAADVVDHDGLRRRMPDLPRQAVQGLGLDDPDGQNLETVRQIRDDLDSRVQRLVDELLPDDR